MFVKQYFVGHLSAQLNVMIHVACYIKFFIPPLLTHYQLVLNTVKGMSAEAKPLTEQGTTELQHIDYSSSYLCY